SSQGIPARCRRDSRSAAPRHSPSNSPIAETRLMRSGPRCSGRRRSEKARRSAVSIAGAACCGDKASYTPRPSALPARMRFMASESFDVVGIGNAIVDVIAQADEAFLTRQGLAKGSMGPGVEMSGGSAANTIAGIASLGGSGAYIGKRSDDALGEVFAHDIRSIGVRFVTAPLRQGAPTARCLILVTPDAQRTMGTFLGASAQLGPDDVAPELIRAAQVTYLEGYLFDPPPAKA